MFMLFTGMVILSNIVASSLLVFSADTIVDHTATHDEFKVYTGNHSSPLQLVDLEETDVESLDEEGKDGTFDKKSCFHDLEQIVNLSELAGTISTVYINRFRSSSHSPLFILYSNFRL